MRKILLAVLLTGAILVGGWALYHKDQINSPLDFIRLASQQLRSLGGTTSQFARWKSGQHQVIRIATFNLQGFGSEKMADPVVSGRLANILCQFDIIAVQNVGVLDENAIRPFVTYLNETGRQFRTVMGGRGIHNKRDGRCGFFYDASTVELDDSRYYSIKDPDRLLHRDALVGWFRARQTDRDSAFTFNLVNLHLNSFSPELEIRHLNQIFRSVRNDGRGEDDVIIAGDFNADDRHLRELGYRHGMSWVISGETTTTRRSRQSANIVLDTLATAEFTGESGVFDFMQRLNLTIDEALEISTHLPVWAEFTVSEASQSPSVAARKSNTGRRVSR